MSLLRFAIACVLCVCAGLVRAEPPGIDAFSPQGTTKAVRQVSARFVTPMVPFGEPRLADPFDVSCAVKGAGRWIDDRNWVYDFARELPAGLRCTFRLRQGVVDSAGQALGAANYTFSTGGPAIVASMPYAGARGIDEAQAFVLALDAAATDESIDEHAWCDVAGIGERLGVKRLQGSDRVTVLEANRVFVEEHLRRTYRPGGRSYRKADWPAVLQAPVLPITVVQCQRRLPNEAQVRLVWGKGVAAASGIATTRDQTLAYQTRPAFRARLTCTRASRKAQCIPVLPIALAFNAPVAREMAEKIVLRGADDSVRAPTLEANARFVQRVVFDGPFPEQASFRMELPPALRDDAGRMLANAASFPLTVKTDENPPLAKFAARFGIVEAGAGAALPVTVRNVAAANAQGAPAIDARLLRVDADSPAAVADWLRKLNTLEHAEWRYDPKTRSNVAVRRVGQQSIFGAADKPSRLQVPMSANAAKDTEVIGIPLKRPGFYVVELASPRLGAVLLGKAQPYYAQAAALVTNLAVHLKLGRESSLVWVTRLDRGAPVAGAEVMIADCKGRRHFRGSTDAAGLLRVPQALPARESLPDCTAPGDRQYLVTARLGDDTGFVLSSWNEGITPWRFNLETGGWDGPYLASTVFDRTLLRAGETVHMKHFFRRHTERGIEYVRRDALVGRVVIRHVGSDDRFELPVEWNDRGIATGTWAIPPEAKQGTYTVAVLDRLDAAGAEDAPREREAGSFRVESFRVPTMKAVLVPPKQALVRAQQAAVDVQVSYLAGGAASLLPVRLRGLVEPKVVAFPGFEGFVLANGDVEQGLERQADSYGEEDETPDAEPVPADGQRMLPARAFTLDQAGGGRFTLDGLPRYDTPQLLIAELEYPDANGERLTASTSIPLWPARVLPGLKLDNWAASRDRLVFDALAVDVDGKPVAGRAIRVDLLTRSYFTHRKRLIGGFYAYDNVVDVKRIGTVCEGKSDRFGLLHCEVKPAVSGNVVLRAEVSDDAGNVAFANRDGWVAGKDDWWFDQKDGDRMDVLPERTRYEPGETARLQVRMPFREATALVTVEREGVLDGFVTRLDGRSPLVEIPVTAVYAPNVYISVLAVRGRVGDVQPTALVDLGKPAFRLGIAPLAVGFQAHELKVAVQPEREVYRVRDKAIVTVRAERADGGRLPAGAEFALAAVDEGLLALAPNRSWQLLDAMMRTRGIEVETATAQMEVIGKRHFGRKALPAGGGGGRMNVRELFETLLVWRERVRLDERGEARVEVPLNDSLTSFRIVAIADADAGLFGTGEARIRTTQDVMLISGLAPLVRDGDRVRNGFTVRNATDQPLSLDVVPRVRAEDAADGVLATPQQKAERVNLPPGQARELVWELVVPARATRLTWEVSAADSRVTGARDAIRVAQEVAPAVPVATLQGTVAQLDPDLHLAVEAPRDALPGRGGIELKLAPTIGGDLAGVREFMRAFPYTCLEQRASQAIALRDATRWQQVTAALPSHLDSDGLARYFAGMSQGSDVLTAYLLSIAHEAGRPLPEAARGRMLDGLLAFVAGRVQRPSTMGAADLALRKLAALDAVSRYRRNLSPRLLDSISIEPNLWPTSSLLDWISLLGRMEAIPERERRLAEARGILRSRMTLQGTLLGLSADRRDTPWWLMVSPDSNGSRALIAMLDDREARADLGRVARGVLARQRHGHWDTTPANAWGVVAMDRFAASVESEPVSGRAIAALGTQPQVVDWNATPSGATLTFPWPQRAGELAVSQEGRGKPWATVLARAAVPLRELLASGYRVVRTVLPVEQKTPGVWTRGDLARVRLELEADQDMTWVVVSDPLPAGASALGSGLGGDSRIAMGTEGNRGNASVAFTERTFGAFRTYYDFVPQGRWSLEYLVRFNSAGRFEMPPTRVEALYAPEMFAALPNAPVEVRP
ncbi:MAG: MG2 domain-containing protein [Burkholderiales bacterium]